jgi:hypothetical protein
MFLSALGEWDGRERRLTRAVGRRDAIASMLDVQEHAIDALAGSVERSTLAEDLDAAVSIGSDVRIARRHMTSRDWVSHIARVNGSEYRGRAAANRENSRYVALSSYLNDGMDTEQALAAWQSQHEGEVLP